MTQLLGGSSKSLQTYIALPPGSPPLDRVRELLQLAFETYRWLTPKRYGFGTMYEIVPTGGLYDTLLDYFQDLGAISITAATDRDYLLLNVTKPDDPPYVGKFLRVTASQAAQDVTWRQTHIQEVVELMRLLHSPVAIAATTGDLRQKTRRLVDMGAYQEEVITVRDYSEGLAGLFWRNFYGPPFVRLFGERLNALPPECVTRLGEELVLVQPYALPTEAGSEAARAREQQLISLLGPECFYDHEHHRPPTRRPVLPPPPWPPPAT